MSALAVNNRRRSRVNLMDHGAIGDGVTSDRLAFARAVSRALALDADLFVPTPDVGYVICDANQNVAIPSNLRIYGEGKETLFMDANGNLSMFALANASGISIRSLGFVGLGPLTVRGRGAVWVTGCTNVELADLYVENVGTCGVVVGASSGVSLAKIHTRDVAEHGVYLSVCSDIKMSDITAIGAGQFGGSSTIIGIKIAESSNVRLSSFEVGNSIAEGVSVQDSTDVQIRDGFIYDCAQRGLRIPAGTTARLRVTDVSFKDNATGDIRDEGSTDTLIRDCDHLSAPMTGVAVFTANTTGFEMYGADVVQGNNGWAFDIAGTNGRVRRCRVRAGVNGLRYRSEITQSDNDITVSGTALSLVS